MSLSDFSSKSTVAIEEPRVEEKIGDDSADKSLTRVSTDHSSPGRCLRDKVLKEVGLTSTAFIGPAFPPETSTAKCDIDDSLSKFYEELEKIDPPDLNQAKSNPEKDDVPPQPPEASASRETRDEPEGKLHVTMTCPETSSYQNKREQTKFSWPHWYRNEPYQLKQQRPTSNQCPYPPFSNRPPYPRFIPPSLPHQPHLPTNPQNLPPYVDNLFNDSRMTNQIYTEFNLPALPPPHTRLHPSQEMYGNPPQHWGWNNTDSDHRIAGWSGNRREEWSWRDENHDQHQRLPQHPDQLHNNTRTFHSSLVLILMRGLPGSGKSTLARELLSTGPSGVILSTDDYFAQKNDYRYDVGLLGAAHEWNQSRAKDAMQDGRSPIIIDNTNLQAWEMKPYVKMALERGYRVDFCEPDTSWKFDPYELEKRNKHGVPHEKITQMMDRFSAPVSIDIVMNSQEPAHVNQRRRAEQPQIRKT